MRNSLWKLTLLTIVVGAGLAFVLYAQRSLNLGLNLASESRPEMELASEESPSATEPAADSSEKKQVEEFAHLSHGSEPTSSTAPTASKHAKKKPHPLGDGLDHTPSPATDANDPFASRTKSAGGGVQDDPFGDDNRVTTVGGVSPNKPGPRRGGIDFRNRSGQPGAVDHEGSPFEKQPEPNKNAAGDERSNPFSNSKNKVDEADPFAREPRANRSPAPLGPTNATGSTAKLTDKPLDTSRGPAGRSDIQLAGHENESPFPGADKTANPDTGRSPNELLDAPGRVSLVGRPKPGAAPPGIAAPSADDPFGSVPNSGGTNSESPPRAPKNAPLLVGPMPPDEGQTPPNVSSNDPFPSGTVKQPTNPLADDPLNNPSRPSRRSRPSPESGVVPVAGERNAASPMSPMPKEGNSPFADKRSPFDNAPAAKVDGPKSAAPAVSRNDGPFPGAGAVKQPVANPGAESDPFGGPSSSGVKPAAGNPPNLADKPNNPAPKMLPKEDISDVRSLPSFSETEPRLGEPTNRPNALPVENPGRRGAFPKDRPLREKNSFDGKEPRGEPPFGGDPLKPSPSVDGQGSTAPTGGGPLADPLNTAPSNSAKTADPLTGGPTGGVDDPLNTPRKPASFSGAIPGKNGGPMGNDNPLADPAPKPGAANFSGQPRNRPAQNGSDPFGALDETNGPAEGSAPRVKVGGEPKPVPVAERDRSDRSEGASAVRPRNAGPSRDDNHDLERNANEPGARSTPRPLGSADPALRPIEPQSQRNAPADVSRIEPVNGNAAGAKSLRGDGTLRNDAPTGPLSPQLKIEKIAPENAVLGKPMIYQIVVRNVGNVAAHQVVVEDRIPKGSELNGTIPQAELAGKKLQWKLGTIKPGEEKKISIRVVPIAEGQIGSIATVNFVTEVAAETKVVIPKLELEFTGPPKGQVGQNLPFRFKVTNKGESEAKGVYIRDIVPDGLRHADGADLEYEVGTLAPGKSFEIELPLKAIRAGTTINRAVATADGNVRVESSVKIDISGSRLLVARTGPKSRYIGRPAIYTNVVSNESTTPALGVRVIETVPEGMEFVEASAGGQFDPARRNVAWSFDKLEPKERRSLSVKLMARKAGTQKSVVSAVDEQGGRVQTVSQTEVEGFSAVGVSIPAVEGPVVVGEELTLRVTVQNRGTGAASNVRVSFTLPEELDFVGLKGPIKHQAAGRTIRLDTIPTLDGKEKLDFDIVVRGKQRGDARIAVLLESDQLQRPLVREEAIPVLDRNP